MTTVTESDLQELKDLINIRFNELDKKIEVNTAVINERLSSINGRLDIMQVSVNKIPDLAEKVGELKNWRPITVIAVTAFISSVVTWLIRGGNLKL